jgi:hypothetical protein
MGSSMMLERHGDFRSIYMRRLRNPHDELSGVGFAITDSRNYYGLVVL